MPIPFLELTGDQPDAAVAYLRFTGTPDVGNVQGAVLVTSARGDPLEFCFTRVDLPAGPLWPPEQIRRRAVAGLAKALFEAVDRLPDLVLALAEETPSEVFVEDMEVQVPVCLVDPHTTAGADPPSLRWVNQEPSDASDLSCLLDSLASRRLLLEPFERAARGLEEALER